MLLGRFKTIITGLLLYIIGFLNLPFLSMYGVHLPRPLLTVWLLLSLLVVSLGEGCFKSNMSPFGADQLEKTPDGEVRKYFNYFYWSINVGSLLGFSLLTWVQQRFGFEVGYVVPSCLLLLTLVVFCVPRTSNYHVLPPSGNMLSKIVRIFCNALGGSRTRTEYESFNPVQHWLDRSKVKYGGRFSDAEVEDAKTLMGILPVFGFLIIYCACYYQIPGTFLIQGLHMRLLSFSQQELVPAAWFMLFNVVIVLIFVPIIDQFFYPLIERCGTRTPFLLRMSIGMFLATLSMLAAGTLELYRSSCTHVHINRVDQEVNITAKDVSIFLQVPQYGLMGLSEIFVLITGLEFAYCQSPKTMQSFVTSLFFIANGIGSFLGTGILAAGNALGFDFISTEKIVSWRIVPALKGHLHYFFYTLAGLNFLNLCCFVVFIARGTKKKKKRELERTVAAYIQENADEPVHSRR